MRVLDISIIPLDGVSSATDFTTDGTAKWSGANGTDSIPQVACLLKLQTGVRGRANRGRVYLPYVSEGATLSGIMTGSIVSSMQTAWTTFLGGVNTASPVGYELGVASYARAHGGTGAHFTPLTQLTVESFTATQRRRQPGRKVARHRSLP
jgi:hypothetical protein